MEVKKFYLDKIAALQKCIATTSIRTNDAIKGIETMIGVVETQSSAEISAFLQPFLGTIKSTIAEMEEKAKDIGTGETK